MPIELTDDTRKRCEAELKEYLSSELDIDVGDLKTTLLVDFIIDTLGVSIYNQALLDMQAQTSMRMQDVVDGLFKGRA